MPPTPIAAVRVGTIAAVRIFSMSATVRVGTLFDSVRIGIG